MRVVAAVTGAIAFALAATPTAASDQTTLASDAAIFDVVVDSISAKKLETLEARSLKDCHKCTSENVVFRREYGSLSHQERRDYVEAVQCLMTLPPRTPANVSTGARSRFDDFVVTHIQQTLTIHYTGNFMPWHRWFVYTYEKALRDECGYKGYQPYWDWPRYASAPQDSPIFDGSETSLGSNGKYLPHDDTVIVPPAGVSGGNIDLGKGLGSGCVYAGPFANMSVNLGPVAGLNGTAAGPDGGLGYNPRCLKRDVGPEINMRYANYTTVLDLLKKPDFDSYRHLSEGIPYTIEIGPHGGVHYVMNGDPGGDLFTSPGDPAFWTHHSMMDRMWTLWQAMDPTERRWDIESSNYGHITWANEPPSRKTTLDDVLDMGYAGESTTIRNVMSTTDGPFCYFYV